VTDQPAPASSPPEPTAVPPGGSGPAAQLAAQVNERPEIAVGGAFAGGLVLGLILKRLARE
jgi:hypothetical protein